MYYIYVLLIYVSVNLSCINGNHMRFSIDNDKSLESLSDYIVHKVNGTELTDCLYVYKIKAKDRCDFVTNFSYCTQPIGRFNYYTALFCIPTNTTFGNLAFISLSVVFCLWLIVLFITIKVIATEFFCPALGVISKMLRLNEDISGKTLLAFGYAAPEVAASIIGGRLYPIVMFNGLLGSAHYTTVFITGLIIILKPFNLRKYEFLRDTIMLFMIGLWVHIIMEKQKCLLMEAIGILIFYLLYVISIIIEILIKKKKGIISRSPNWDKIHHLQVRYSTASSISNINVSRPTQNCNILILDLIVYLNPFPSKEEWDEITCLQKILFIMKFIPLIIFRLFIPLVSGSMERNGWCKLLCCINCILFPMVMLLMTSYYNLYFGMHIMLLAFLIGLCLAIIVGCTSKYSEPPKYHKVFAFACFIGSLLSIYAIAKEIISILLLIGSLSGISIGVLSITLQTWGMTISDLVISMNITKQGFQKAAYSACFGRAIFSLSVGLGITMLIRNLHDKDQTDMDLGSMGPVSSLFFLMNMFYSVMYVFIINFKARRSYGVFLILMYLQFILFCFISEIGFMYPLGTFNYMKEGTITHTKYGE